MALEFNFICVGHGKLALSQRPKIKEIQQLREIDCHRVVTILSPTGEEAQRLGQEVKKQGMKWSWVKISNAKLIGMQERYVFLEALSELENARHSGESILIHCSAGIHRTGMMAYGLLLRLGFNKNEALHVIEQMRYETYIGLESKYLELVEEII